LKELRRSEALGLVRPEAGFSRLTFRSLPLRV
jgi:hypothetical protein